MHLTTAIFAILGLTLASPQPQHTRRGIPSPPSTPKAQAAKSAPMAAPPPEDFEPAVAPDLPRMFPPGGHSLPNPFGAFHPQGNGWFFKNAPRLVFRNQAPAEWMRVEDWEAYARYFANHPN
ncbi:hypothetical protein CDD80_5446 [Ophiocordyceps camponoti-rufipedis]|uniref:Uncharacterized protein n=1 Tax=Ophiocordyceps camponoti-rufipedis TaxID=2004952 RepID=A0A2C5ZHG6_9HYPO|nr:hypothetical protein CDD80_5446 [Ophiocordyceps camponoti-rufipedis]